MINTRNVRISRGKVKRIQKLLNMRYKPSEVAEVIGVGTDTIYKTYLPAGAPCEKDSKGHIWIVGDVFAKWALECSILNTRKPAKVKLQSGQTYCLHCNQVVDIHNPSRGNANNHGVFNISGTCPICGGKVNRFCSGSNRQAEND